MRYTFRWRCVELPAEVTITVSASDDSEAGTLAATALRDLSLGHGRRFSWRPFVPVISTVPQ